MYFEQFGPLLLRLAVCSLVARAELASLILANSLLQKGSNLEDGTLGGYPLVAGPTLSKVVTFGKDVCISAAT
jgi:hypothetical protein